MTGPKPLRHDRPVAQPANDMLVTMLQVAVPMWIEKAATWPPGSERLAVLARWAEDGADQLAHSADVMLFGGGTKGEAATVFNHLARGIAALAHAHGGVTVFGTLWCATHSVVGTAPGELPWCPGCVEQ